MSSASSDNWRIKESPKESSKNWRKESSEESSKNWRKESPKESSQDCGFCHAQVCSFKIKCNFFMRGNCRLYKGCTCLTASVCQTIKAGGSAVKKQPDPVPVTEIVSAKVADKTQNIQTNKMSHTQTANSKEYQYKRLLIERYSEKKTSSMNTELFYKRSNLRLFYISLSNEKAIVRILEDLMGAYDIDCYLDCGEPEDEYTRSYTKPHSPENPNFGLWTYLALNEPMYGLNQTGLHLLAKHSTRKFINFCMWLAKKEGGKISDSYDRFGISPIDIIMTRGYKMNNDPLSNKYFIEEELNPNAPSENCFIENDINHMEALLEALLKTI